MASERTEDSASNIDERNIVLLHLDFESIWGKRE